MNYRFTGEGETGKSKRQRVKDGPRSTRALSADCVSSTTVSNAIAMNPIYWIADHLREPFDSNAWDLFV